MSKPQQTVNALKFKQWLNIWDNFEYSDARPHRKPKPEIYMFSMSAAKLRTFSDVYKRERIAHEAEGIQRKRDDKRTERIKKYVQHGYPYGDLQESQRTDDKEQLKKPGWLPTAIVINIMEAGEPRKGRLLKKEHAASIACEGSNAVISLPEHETFDQDDVRPFEVIDGQHRLWAFDEDVDGDFELPVVAFCGLDVAWQAYLFWSINVSPKRINPSHAFDLYPLLRNQTWLEQTGDLTVYREARAQEITEWLYKHPDSAWYNRINMLGESGAGRVSQAAFVRSLTTAFFGTGRGSGGRYGLFQASSVNGEPLQWSRSQQCALLLELWALISDKVGSVQNLPWTDAFTNLGRDPLEDKSSLLNQDMGVRAVHAVINDILFHRAETWKLHEWQLEVYDETETTQSDIEQAWLSLKSQQFHSNIEELSSALVQFDWRSLDGPGVRDSRELSLARRAYRGSGGYTLLTSDILKALASYGGPGVAAAAAEMVEE